VIVGSVIAVPVAATSPVAGSAAKPTAVTNRVWKDVSITEIASAPTAAAYKPA
jgi:hypothetical protein